MVPVSYVRTCMYDIGKFYMDPSIAMTINQLDLGSELGCTRRSLHVIKSIRTTNRNHICASYRHPLIHLCAEQRTLGSLVS